MSFWSGLGHILKVAAPIAAAFIPGVGPIASALISAGIGAGTGAMNGGGVKGALEGGALGAAGNVGGNYIKGLMSGVGSAAKGATTMADGIPNIPVTSGLPTVAGSAVPSATAGSTIEKLLLGNGTPNSQGIIQNMLSPNGLQSIGKGLGGVAQADATNRGVKLSAMIASDNAKLAEQAQRNQDLNALPGQIQKADYLASGGYTPKQNFSSTGRAIPKFDLGLAPISANSKAAGATLEKQLTDRLNTPPTYNDYSSVMDPSATETALNWASPILTATGAGSQPPDPTTALLAKLLAPVPLNTPAPTAPPVAPPPGMPMPGTPVAPMVTPPPNGGQ